MDFTGLFLYPCYLNKPDRAPMTAKNRSIQVQPGNQPVCWTDLCKNVGEITYRSLGDPKTVIPLTRPTPAWAGSQEEVSGISGERMKTSPALIL